MDISVIIVNYNTRELTRQCVDSIFEHAQGVSFEVVLVDNASSDGSEEEFRADSRIKFVQSGANVGFGRANNLGYEHCQDSKYILLLNSDTKLLNNALKIFYDYMESAPENIASCGTQLLNAQGERFVGSGAWGGEQTSALKEIFTVIRGVCKRLLPFMRKKNQPLIPEPPFEVGYVVGADIFMRNSVIKECGMFDPDFFMYAEEVEMMHRFIKAGYKNMIIGGARIIHYVKASTGKVLTPRFHTMFNHGRFLYFKKTNCAPVYYVVRLFELLRIPSTVSSSYTMQENWSLVKLFFKRTKYI